MDIQNSTVEASTLDAFMDGPFLQWLRAFPEAPAALAFDDLTAGVFLNNVMQHFDAAFSSGAQLHQNPTNFHARVTNMEHIIKNLKSYYEDELGQTLVVKLPDPLAMCHEPPIDRSLQEMDRLLLLILGAAVQCSHKEDLIGSIKNLPFDTQHAFMAKIKEVTDNPQLIWSSELDNPENVADGQKGDLYSVLVHHLKTLVRERDSFAHKIVEITLASPSATQETMGITPERNHLALEVSEYKAKIRKLNQQLEEKTENLSECKEEMEKYMSKFAKLRQESLELTQEARAARALRDELDIQRERANKVHHLESELQSYKDKIGQMESLKSRMEEVKEENKILGETKDMLEEQLEGSRKRCQQILGLESELFRYKSELNGYKLEQESDKKRIESLMEENLALQMNSKSSISESQSLLAEMEIMKGHKGNDTNILTEQLGQGMTRIHRLELENKKLRAENDDLKLNGFQASADRMLELEKDNKKCSLAIRQFESAHAKDTEVITKLERELHEWQTRHRQSEQVVSTLKEADEHSRIEKDAIIENLNKQLDSMRKRQEKNTTQQVEHLVNENGRLVKDVTLMETKVNKLSRDNDKLMCQVSEYKVVADQVDDLMGEKEKLMTEIDTLLKANEELVAVKEADSMEQLDSVNQKLTKLKGEKEKLYAEHSKLQLEFERLKSRAESLKETGKKIHQLEFEREEQKDTLQKLVIKVDNLSRSLKTVEEQEQKVSLENNRLVQQKQTLKRKLSELEAVNNQVESENGKLEKTIDNLRITARHVEQLEKDNITLESNQHKTERENKSLTKEIERLKQDMEVKDVTMEDINSKLINAERQWKKLARDLEQWNEEQAKMSELEQANRKLSQQCSLDKRAIVKLREELVDEKLKCDNLTNKLDTLHKQLLQKLGIDHHALDGQVELISNERMKNLEGSMTTLLESRQKRIEALETSLKEAKTENIALTQKTEVLKLKSQGVDNRVSDAQVSSVVQERDQLRKNLADVTMDLTASTEKLKMYEERLKKLHEDSVASRVEHSTLQSQSSSLLSQINTLQTTQAAIEASKRKLEESEKTWKSEREELLRDQAGLQKLHDNLQQDYDRLLKERDAQKDVERHLKTDLRKLQAMSVNLNEDQEKLVSAKEALDLERQTLRADARTLENLRSEHARLKDDFRSLFTSHDRIKGEYCNLQSDYKALKTNYNQQKLQQTELKGNLGEAKEQLTLLDVEHSKAINRCEVLSQLNLALEEDRKALMSQVSLLLSQYHELLTQTMDDKEHFHEEEKYFSERMNNLCRQKEKLEEKIMEQYKHIQNPTPKKLGFGGQLVRKMRKASSNLISGTSRGRVSGVHSREQPSSGVHDDGNDSSSVGSGGNDSLGSGQHSPNEMTRSESAVELRGRKASLPVAPVSQIQKTVFRKSLPPHLEDSDGNNADDDSVNSSFISPNMRVLEKDYHEKDEVPTRDLGPDRLGHQLNQSFSSHSELGLPVLPTDNRGRAVSRVYLNGQGSSEQRSTTPQLTAWKSNNSSPAPSSDTPIGDITPPAVPARKHSRAGQGEMPPQRPPKPLNGRRTSEDIRSSASGGSSPTLGAVDDDIKKDENAEWYEYGCV